MDFLVPNLDWMLWQRQALAEGQVWRLVTPAFVHLGWTHALANAAGLLIWWRLESLGPRPLSGRAKVAAFLAGAVLLHLSLLLTDYEWYAGASGVLYGLFVFTGLRGGRRGLVVVAALLAWLTVGPSLVSYSFPVAHLAHWLGAGLAALLWGCTRLRSCVGRPPARSFARP